MDTLGKAYGQIPTVCTPFQLQHVGNLCAPVFYFLFLEKEKIYLFSVLTIAFYEPGPAFQGGIYYQ